MLWFFDREDKSLNLETRYDTDTSEFVVIIRYPGRDERIERFADRETFAKWLQATERYLDEDHWTARTGPIILPYGWPNKPPR